MSVTSFPSVDESLSEKIATFIFIIPASASTLKVGRDHRKCETEWRLSWYGIMFWLGIVYQLKEVQTQIFYNELPSVYFIKIHSLYLTIVINFCLCTSDKMRARNGGDSKLLIAVEMVITYKKWDTMKTSNEFHLHDHHGNHHHHHR